MSTATAGPHMMLRSLAYLTALVLVPAACTDANDDKPDDELFELGEPGKADGVLSSAERARLLTAFDEAITAGEAVVAQLEQEIAQLEARHAQKRQEADNLVWRIQQREAELQTQYNNNLILCAFFPNPATCVLANYLLNDSVLQQYKRDLEAARAEQQRVVQEVSRYQARRSDIRARVAEIRAGKQRLVTLLQDNTLPPPPEALADAPAAAAEHGRLAVMNGLHSAVQEEIAELVELRNAAVELANVLDQSVATLRAIEHSVELLVQRQRDRFMDALAALTSGNPAAAAEKWLEDALAVRTRELLNRLEWPLNEFARHLATSRGSGDLDALAKRILTKLLAASEPRTFRATTAVQIHDLTRATSALQINDNRAFSALEVFVDIQHTYRGDLVVWLEKGEATWMLSNRTGGSADNLVKTWSLRDVGGVALSGTWRLHIEDKEAGDTGKLRRWELIAR
jgi:hypothetical protein